MAFLLAGAWVASCAEDDGKRGLRIQPIEPHFTFVGEFLAVPFTVDGSRGRPLTLSHAVPAVPFLDRVTFVAPGLTGGEFQFTPLAEHVGTHEFVIIADNGDEEARRTFVVEVISARDASPVFLRPGRGSVIDVASSGCVTLPIEVHDRDTPDPLLSVVFGLPPSGAEFETLGPNLAELRWCLTPDQIAAAGHWTMTFAADDGVHDPVLHDYRFVLSRPRKEACGGAIPVVDWESPDDGEHVISRVGYTMRMRVEDDSPLRDWPVLLYTEERIEQRDRIDLERMRFAQFEPRDDGVWTARIPSFRLAYDEARSLTLIPWVDDDDDPTGTRCDNRAELRQRQFTAVGAVEAGILDLCDTCMVSGDCVSGVCARTGLGGRCIPSCSNTEPCDDGVECRSWNSMEGVVREGCGPAELLCDGFTACVADDFEPNDTAATAATLTPGTAVEATACDRDDDWYEVPIVEPSRVTVETDTDRGGLEVQLLSADGIVLAVNQLSADGGGSVSACADASGPIYVRAFSASLRQVPYTMRTTVVPEGCACIDDAHEPSGFSSPRSLPSGEAVEADGTICGADSDVFAIEPSGRHRTRITLEHDASSADLDMDLLAPNGALIAASRGLTDVEEVEVDLVGDVPYIVRVFSYDGRDGDYSLRVSHTPLQTCETSRDCEADEVCDDERCTRRPCSRNADCEADEVCPRVDASQPFRTCSMACARDGDCASGAACKRYLDGRACAASGAGRTGERCESSTDCADERVCVDWPGGHCAAAACTRDVDCGGDGACVVVDGFAVCVETCWLDDDDCSRADETRCTELFSPSAELVYGCIPGDR